MAKTLKKSIKIRKKREPFPLPLDLPYEALYNRIPLDEIDEEQVPEPEEEVVEVGEDQREYEEAELRRQGYGDGGLEFQYTDDDEDDWAA